MVTWTCTRPDCATENAGDNSHCTVCQAPRSGRSVAVPHIQAMDLDRFLRLEFQQQRRQLRGQIYLLDDEVFLSLEPLNDRAVPRLYRIDHNEATPCDNFGRPGW